MELSELKYSAEHEWVDESSPVKVGLSAVAADSLGDVVYLEQGSAHETAMAAALAAAASLAAAAVAQNAQAPESLLPPGFGEPVAPPPAAQPSGALVSWDSRWGCSVPRAAQ